MNTSADLDIILRFPQAPVGSSSRLKYYFRSHAAVITLCTPVGDVDLQRSGRILSWRSGNWSSRAKRVVASFEKDLADYREELARGGLRKFIERHTRSTQANGRRVRNWLLLDATR